MTISTICGEGVPILERDAMAGSREIWTRAACSLLGSYKRTEQHCTILVLSCNTIEEGYEDSKADGGDEGELELHLELG